MELNVALVWYYSRQMIRRPFVMALVLSLLLSMVVAMMWMQSCRREMHVTGLTRAGRWTVRSSNGRLAVFVPPRPAPGAPGAKAPSWAASVLAEKPEWHINCQIGGGFFYPGPDRPVGISWWGGYEPFGAHATDGSAVPLLAALESPRTFVRAHIVLARIYGTNERISFEGQPALRDDGVARRLPATIDGLRVVLRDPHDRIIPHGSFAYYTVSVEVDAAQLSLIRDQWHRRLDVPVGAVRYSYLLIATLAIPFAVTFAGIARRVRRRARRLNHRCPSCGYDLRASNARCPECGTPISSDERC
ncbi:MAG TPA: hypothetical protein VGI81_19260 [Tepidisphaeraceae bacterium]